MVSWSEKEDEVVEGLLEEWNLQDYLEEIVEEDLEEEQDAQDLINLLFFEDEEVI